MTGMKIAVIGAGILGLSTAHALVARGHHVELIDKEGVYAGASRRSFAWINANHKLPESYHRLNAAGIAEHHLLQDELAEHGTWFHPLGCILADNTAEAEQTYASRFEESSELDYPVERVSRGRLEELEPQVRWPIGLDEALFFPSEAHLDNHVLGRVLADLLATHGVVPRIAEIDAVEPTPSGTVVHVREGADEVFDKVVIAAGAESRELADRSGLRLPVASLDEPGQRTHSLLGISAPTDVELRRVLISDAINVRPRHDGRLFIQLPPVEHRTSEGESPELLSEVAGLMESAVEELFGTPIAVDEVIFSGRSLPEDGLSIAGYLDDTEQVYGLVTHSGMTLGPLLGRLTASELAGREEPLLADFRPSRFVGGYAPVEQGGFIGKQ